jgi:hypothetical protein
MQDYEVRDVMRRRSDAIVKTELRIIIDKHRSHHRVYWRVSNESDVLARWVCSIIEIPCVISDTHAVFEECEIFCDDDGYTFWHLVASNHGEGPLYPRGSMHKEFPFKFVQNITPVGTQLKVREIVKFKTFADEMPHVSGSFDLKEITH